MAKKYKFKPNKSLLKRVKVTGRGKVKFHHAGASHLMSGTPGKAKRKMRKGTYAKAGDVLRLERMLGQRLIPADRQRPDAAAAAAAAE